MKFSTSENPKIYNLLQKIASSEPAFSFVGTSFLDAISFNSHNQSSGDDYWSTWTGNSASTFSMNGGMSGAVNDGKWYGFSYGFSNPSTQAPVTPIPAYSSLWFPTSSITNWVGTGANQSVVIVDFGTDSGNAANSFAYGIKYDGTITAEQALQIIASQTSNFTFTSTSTQVTEVHANSFSGVNNTTNTWKTYKGINLSNWITQTNLSQINLQNGSWLGLSYGTRRPYLPQIASNLSTQNINVAKKEISIYPNPTTDYININTNEKIISVNIYSITGQIILKSNTDKVDMRNITSGNYILELTTDKTRKSFKIIKK